MNSTLINNAQIITPDGIISGGSVWIEDGLIRQVGTITNPMAMAGQVLDAGGDYVMPGIIDIHTDAMDAEIVPRPGADIPIDVAFRELERKMCTCGITTVYHSLHLGYIGAQSFSRSKYTRATVFSGVHACAQRPALIRNKIHLRFELTGVNAYDECVAFMNDGLIDLLSVMDHTPGQGQMSEEQFRKYMLAKGKSEAEFDRELQDRLSWPKIEGDRLEALLRVAKGNGIPVASHDDDTIEKVDAMLALGVKICEFPINLETARYAMKMGMHVAGGASNILRGGSLSGNMDMTEGVLEGAVDVLCSDYYPPAILHSIFKLHQENGMPLHETVNLATLNPAESAGLGGSLGSIESGKEADVIVIRVQDGLPMVTNSFVKGNLVLQTTAN
jgi:alpha-D-ribose 1-methylphosphonate 5-triphosphate diphosphatase